MYKNKNLTKLISLLFLICISFSLSLFTYLPCSFSAYASPYFANENASLTLRAKFYTTYYSSSCERVSNILLASSTINGTFLDVNEEFSFNKIVGARTENNGYKNAKIILGGKFVDGVGGGVCQVSTTLYNAVLLAGLIVSEYHPHSLQVSYVAPSFDAMVSSGSADLKFVNNTKSPLLIKSSANDYMLTIEIYGEVMHEKYIRQSTVLEELPAPPEEEVFVTKDEYPELNIGDKKTILYSKKGLKSQGSLAKVVKGKIVSVKKIRTDIYKGVKGVTVMKKNVE